MNPILPIKLLLRDIRRHLRCLRILQVLHCLVGAVWLYLALDNFLTGAPFASALDTVVAFFMWRLFENGQDQIASMRYLKDRVRELETALNPPPPSTP